MMRDNMHNKSMEDFMTLICLEQVAHFISILCLSTVTDRWGTKKMKWGNMLAK